MVSQTRPSPQSFANTLTHVRRLYPPSRGESFSYTRRELNYRTLTGSHLPTPSSSPYMQSVLRDTQEGRDRTTQSWGPSPTKRSVKLFPEEESDRGLLSQVVTTSPVEGPVESLRSKIPTFVRGPVVLVGPWKNFYGMSPGCHLVKLVLNPFLESRS